MSTIYQFRISVRGAEHAMAFVRAMLETGPSLDSSMDAVELFYDELSDDETADDISTLMNQRQEDDDKLHTLERYVNDTLGDNPTPDRLRGMIADIKGVQSTMTHSNPRMRALDHLIMMLSGEVSRLEGDQTPPHGIERPAKRVSAPKGSGQRLPGIEDMARCSTCHADIGESCRSEDGHAYARGYGHAARLRAAKEVIQS